MKRERIISAIMAVALAAGNAATTFAESIGIPEASPEPKATPAPDPMPIPHPAPAPAPDPLAAPDPMPLPEPIPMPMPEPSRESLPDFAANDTLVHYSCPYFLPYSLSYSAGNWKRLWLNTAVLCGAFVTTLGVLELLPENATAWNRKDIQSVPPFNRWWRNIFKLGPEWDHDKWVFNYLLHPYAGAAYFMSARSCGFNFYQSLLYSALISTVGWEFGVEAFMERPSYQDLFITPLVGSLMGEGFYRLKRYIVNHDYCLFGSPVIGNIVALLIDPVNEVIGLFAGNDCRYKKSRNTEVASGWWSDGANQGFSLTCYF